MIAFIMAVHVICHLPRQITLFDISQLIAHFKYILNDYNYTFMNSYVHYFS